MLAPSTSTLRVTKRWLIPPLATPRLATMCDSLDSSTSLLAHQGRNSG